MYAAVGRVAQEKGTTYMESTYMELAGSSRRHHGLPSFDHKITATIPIPLNEIINYMASCHSNNNQALYTQFKVLRFPSLISLA